MSYKFEELELLARQAGFDSNISPIMAAIAMGESGGDPYAYNPDASTGDKSYGLMQINMLGDMGPARRAAFNLQSNEDLFDPVTNFKAAKSIYDSQGLGAWGAYTNKSYEKFLPGNFTPLKGSTQSSSLQMPGDSSGEIRMAGSKRKGEGILGVALNNVADAMSMGEQPAQPKRMAMTTQMPALADNTGGAMTVVDVGRKLQDMGFQVREHPAFGGVGKHSPNSHHYAGHALDLTIQPGSKLLEGRPDSDWRQLTADAGRALQAMYPGAEIFHPGYDTVGGHGTHIHLAFPGGVVRR